MDIIKRFERQSLDGAVFHDCTAVGADFGDVNLSGSSFVNVSLKGSTLEDVDLSGVTIDNANIDGLSIMGHDIKALIRAAGPRPKPEGQVSFLEIGSADAAATRAFFAKVFGWTCHDDAWLQTGSIKVGTHGDDPAPQVYAFFGVTDIEAAAARVRAAGGETDPATTAPGFGRFVNCRAPGGVRFGLHAAV
jgi:predicted enzyme related to lactoylglutathione lyase